MTASQQNPTELVPISTAPAIASPSVRIFTGRSESFVQCGSQWHRLTAEDEAKMHTGYSRDAHAPNVGIYIFESNGRAKIGFDVWKLGVNLTPAVLERLETQWRSDDAALFSKRALRTIGRKVHISKSFVTIMTLPERIEYWRAELESILSDPHSFERIERRSTMPDLSTGSLDTPLTVPSSN